MNEKDIEQFLDTIYKYVFKRLKNENFFKNNMKSINATISWIPEGVDENNIGKNVKVKFPYESSEILVPNKSTSQLSIGDVVCLHYCIDLKNSYVAYKV